MLSAARPRAAGWLAAALAAVLLAGCGLAARAPATPGAVRLSLDHKSRRQLCSV